MEQHRNAFSSGQSLVQMDTVADGLASLSFHQGTVRERAKKRRKDSGNRREVEGKKMVLTVSTESCGSASLHINIADQEVELLNHSTQFGLYSRGKKLHGDLHVSKKKKELKRRINSKNNGTNKLKNH